MHAFYNITNNRLFFYPDKDKRLTPEQDKERKECSFQWWPRGCWTAIWSPDAEDFIRSFGVEIGADDTPDDVESRVERFTRYAEKAESSADDAAERAATANTARRARLAENRAQNEAERAEYWTRRIAGAIAHAERHDDPRTCANRVKGIEADKRKQERNLEEHKKFLKFWSAPGLTTEQAKKIANYDGFSICFPKAIYPASTYEGPSSLWSGLERGYIDGTQAAALAIPWHEARIKHAERWIEHLNMRLEYERAYLDAVGGSELLNPKPRKAPAKAPEDGLKKGMRVTWMGGAYYNIAFFGTIISLGSKTVKIARDGDKSGYPQECPRRRVKAA